MKVERELNEKEINFYLTIFDSDQSYLISKQTDTKCKSLLTLQILGVHTYILEPNHKNRYDHQILFLIILGRDWILYFLKIQKDLMDLKLLL